MRIEQLKGRISKANDIIEDLGFEVVNTIYDAEGVPDWESTRHFNTSWLKDIKENQQVRYFNTSAQNNSN